MKYLLSIFFLFFCLKSISAQEKHFLFIQSDTKQPFYVSVNGKLYSSSASGYLIIPKLTEGNYNLTVGFAQNAFPEQAFTCSIQNKDLGFELKNLNDKGWGLFNLQTLDLTMASSGTSDVVSKALSENAAAKAPPPVISFEKKKETVQPDKTTDTISNLVAKSDEAKESIAKVDSPEAASTKSTAEVTVASVEKSTTAKYDKSGDVKKVSEVKGEEGVHLSYVEGSGKTKDTINVIIPSSPTPSAPENSINTGSPSSTKNEKTQVGNEAKSNSKTGAAKDEVKFLDIDMSTKKDSVQVVLTPKENGRIFENSNCKNIATDDDYAKLRKKMATETTDDKMISEAKKFYRNKCFTTSQIKGLSTLFLSDEGRFKFFDASFVSVADASQYASLQTEFIDPAYVTRFKGLLQ
jgi:hypothetical protein